MNACYVIVSRECAGNIGQIVYPPYPLYRAASSAEFLADPSAALLELAVVGTVTITNNEVVEHWVVKEPRASARLVPIFENPHAPEAG